MKKFLYVLVLALAVMTVVSCKQDVHQHTWNSGEITTPATCESIGIKTFTCTGCGEKKIEAVDKLSHIPGDPVVTQATCEDEGSRDVKCTLCGKVITHEVIPPTGHNWGLVEQISEPGCETSGKALYACALCQAEKTEDIAPLGHDFSGDVERIESTCVTHGYEFGFCTRCDRAVRQQLPLSDHTWDEGEITENPTCTQKGLKTYCCVYCDEEKTEDIAALGHDYVFDSVVTASTCSTHGSALYICSRCFDEDEHDLDLDPDNHEEMEWVTSVEAGILFGGEEIEVCSGCGEETGNSRDVDPIGIQGFWRSSEKNTTLAGSGLQAVDYYELAMPNNENMSRADMFINLTAYDMTLLQTVIGGGVTVSTEEEDILDDSWIGAVKIDYGAGIMTLGIKADSADSFTLGLFDANNEPADYEFTKISDDIHNHTVNSTVGNPYNSDHHTVATTCSDHDTLYIITECHFEDEVCTVCGNVKQYDVMLLVNEQPYGPVLTGTHAGGVILPELPDGFNYWSVPGQGIYYGSGDVYYPEAEASNMLVAVFLDS